jgi:hypothetical protein
MISDIHALPDFLLARGIVVNRPPILREDLHEMPATRIRLPQPCAVRDPHTIFSKLLKKLLDS